MSKVSANKVTLTQLEQLATEGKMDELQTTLKQCLFSDLRVYLNVLGVKVRTKQYEKIRSKEDHVTLLAQVLLKKSNSDVPAVEGAVQVCNHTKSNGAAASNKLTESNPAESSAATRVGDVLVPAAPALSKDAERMRLVQCINSTGDALTQAESRKEKVLGLKRTLACELEYYVKRLKRIQQDDSDED